MTTTPLSAPPATQISAPLATWKAAPQAAPPGHGGLGSLVVDVRVPLASYYLLRAAGCGVVVASALSSVAPAAEPRLDGDYVRDEGEQVRYLSELLEVFSGPPRHDDPRRDMDLASYGVVAIGDDKGTDCRPKESFHALAAAYGQTE